MEKIRTATGKEFLCDTVSMLENSKRLYITIEGSTISEIATVFSNPSETVQLYYGKLYIAQFTKLVAIVPQNGAVRVTLTKE